MPAGTGEKAEKTGPSALPGAGRRAGIRAALLLAVALGFRWLAGYTSNALLWIVIAAGLLALLFAVAVLAAEIARRRRRAFRPAACFKLAALLCALTAVVCAAELLLAIGEGRALAISTRAELEATPPVAAGRSLPIEPEAAANVARRRLVFNLPRDWEMQHAEVDGATRAYRWHGVVHVLDESSFRRTTPFPEKRPGIARVVVVGDSLTYGQAIEARFSYSSILQRELERDFEVEVLNLGVSGNSSGDILEIVRRFVPRLVPDLVVYGICQNDFLPSGTPEYKRGFSFPIPWRLEAFLTLHSRFARFMSQSYDAALRAAGLRVDFYDDILSGFEDYGERFGRDLAAMNAFVIEQGLPPIVAMVLDTTPEHDGRGYGIARAAEAYAREAGMRVIPTEGYYIEFDGRNFGVSLWEGHPNEEAHAIFASMLLPELRDHAALRAYRLAGGERAGAKPAEAGPAGL